MGILIDGIGGTAAGAGNVIAYSGGRGRDGPGDNTGDAILSNSIFGNGNLGINLGPGSNQDQVPPVLESAFFSAGTTTIAGTFDAFDRIGEVGGAGGNPVGQLTAAAGKAGRRRLDELAAEMAAWERDSVAGTRSPLMARGRR